MRWSQVVVGVHAVESGGGELMWHPPRQWVGMRWSQATGSICMILWS